jgi:hypothetical protein
MAKSHIKGIMSASSQTEIREALRDLSSGIDEMYQKDMQRIRSQPQKDKELAERTLLWVFGSRRQLTIPELQHALAVLNLKPDQNEVPKADLPHPDIVFEVCQGLLIQEVVFHNHYIRPAHYTAVEYFESAYKKEFPNGKEEIARACVSYLSLSKLYQPLCSYMFVLRNNIHGRFKPFRYERTLAKERRLLLETEYSEWKFLNYSAHYWSFHVNEAFRPRAGLLVPLSKYIFWGTSLSYVLPIWDESPEWVPPRDLIDAYHQVVPMLKSWIGEPLTQELIQNINTTDEHGRTILFYASQAGHIEAVNFLLELDGIKIEETELKSNDPLFVAVDRTLINVTQAMLPHIIVVQDSEDKKSQKRYYHPALGSLLLNPAQNNQSQEPAKRILGTYSLRRIRELQARAKQGDSVTSNPSSRHVLQLLNELHP